MRLDPRTKMVIVLCLSTLALIYNTPGRLLLLLAGTVILLLILRLKLGEFLGYIRKFLPLFIFLLLVQSIFTRGGEVLLTMGTVPLITTKGLELGISVVLRMMVVIASAVLLTTSNSRDIVLGMVHWKFPYEIAFMFSVSLRFLPTFREELSNVITAVQLRGVELKKVPWGRKIALYRCLFFPVAYGAIEKAQQLSIAMETRGFRAYPQRTYLRKLQFGSKDYVLSLLFPVATLMLILLQI
ncbi:MAG TPA: energy-coupling factor transporter transmembrane component T [Desulfosporosinus sp.]|nr:energy-coupling factor transporter transmembrane component T [Desulfosporosinus sp.]